MKKIALAGGFLLVCMVLAATGGQERPAAAAAPAKSVSLRVLSYTTEPVPRVQDAIFAKFMSANAGIKLEVERVPFNELYRKIAVAVASGTPYDAIYVDGPMTNSYARNGIIIPLDPYFSKEELADFFPSSIEECSADGKLYAIPERQSATAVFFNKKLLATTGIAVPDRLENAWSMDQFSDVLKKVTQRDSAGKVTVWGLAQMSKYRLYSDYSFIRSNGADKNSPVFKALDAANKTASGYLDHPDTIAALKFWQDLHQVHQVMPTQQSPDMFENGLSAFYQASDIAVGRLKKDFPNLDWGVMPQPFFKTPIVHTGSFHWGIMDKSQNQAAAVRFLKYVTSKEALTEFHLGIGQLPPRKSIFESVDSYKNYPQKLFADSLMKWGVPRPQTPAYSEYENFMFQMLKDIILGADVKAAVADTVKKVNEVLKKY